METIIISAGLLLPKLNYQLTIAHINNTILPADKKITQENRPAIMGPFMAIDQAFNTGKIDEATFCSQLKALFCEQLNIDADTFEIDPTKLANAWNAMLGNPESFSKMNSVLDTLLAEEQHIILISKTNPIHAQHIREHSMLGSNDCTVTYLTTYEAACDKHHLFQDALEQHPKANVILGNSVHVKIEAMKTAIDQSNQVISCLAAATQANIHLLDPHQDIMDQLLALEVADGFGAFDVSKLKL